MNGFMRQRESKVRIVYATPAIAAASTERIRVTAVAGRGIAVSPRSAQAAGDGPEKGDVLDVAVGLLVGGGAVGLVG